MNVHPVVAAFSAKRKKFKVDFNHPLEETLLALPAIFSIKGELRCHRIILSLHGDTEGSTASTVFNTDNGDVNRLVAMAVKSMFGRNNETIFDETVRKGLELRADEHIFSVKLQDRYSGNESLLESELKDLVKRLAIYQEGGFFVTHRDTPHAHNHQATLLVFLPFVHTGGALVLEAGDQTVTYFSSGDGIRWCAFYTDVPHHVEPVLSGTRCMLQYDVLVEVEAVVGAVQTSVTESNAKEMENQLGEDDGGNKEGDRNIDDSATNSRDEDEDKDEDSEEVLARAKKISDFENKSCPIRNFAADEITTLGIRTNMVNRCVEVLLKSTTQTMAVALPMFGLYTMKSVTPTLLKRLDRELFNAILDTDNFAIALVPIMISVVEYFRDTNEEFNVMVTPCESLNLHAIHVKGKSIAANNGTSEVVASILSETSVPISIPDDITFVGTAGMNKFYLTGYGGAEHTGNESMDAEHQYFSVAMIVWRKP